MCTTWPAVHARLLLSMAGCAIQWFAKLGWSAGDLPTAPSGGHVPGHLEPEGVNCQQPTGWVAGSGVVKCDSECAGVWVRCATC